MSFDRPGDNQIQEKKSCSISSAQAIAAERIFSRRTVLCLKRLSTGMASSTFGTWHPRIKKTAKSP